MSLSQGIFNLDTLNATTKCVNNEGTRITFAVISIILVIVGLIGNSMIFFIVLMLKEYKKSVANWYILQLALADTLFLLMLPFTAASELQDKWTYGLSMCKIKEAILFINYYASIYFLVVMSFDRYLAVTRAFAASKWINNIRSPKAAFVITLIGWIVSVFLCYPLFYYSTVDSCEQCNYQFPDDDDSEYYDEISPFETVITYDDLTSLAEQFLQEQGDKEPYFQCRYDNSSFIKWIYSNFFVAFVLPCVLIIIFYGLIIKTIRNSAAVGRTESQRTYRRRVTFIILALVGLFMISWLPWYVVNLARIRGISLTKGQCANLTYAVRILAYMNSALNPYFYSFLGNRFKTRWARARSRISRGSTRSRVGSREVVRKRKYSTSNSQSGKQPIQCNPWRGNLADQNRDEDARLSTMQRTERTIL